MGEKQSKGYWQEDEEAPACNGCGRPFTATLRRHHCRNCGYIYCGACSRHRAAIPMRGITELERVCDACYLALRNSNVAGTSMGRGGPGTVGAVNPSETPDRPDPVNAGGPAGEKGAADGKGLIGGGAAAAGGVAGTAAAAASAAPEMTEEQRRAEEYYQGLYGGDGDDAAGAAGAPQEAVSQEALERERLIQRWNMVRQATVYVDILVQQSERVEPDTAVEYSRETESLTLVPELPAGQLALRMLPLPRPSTDSTRYVVEPVAPMAMPHTTLEKVAADLTQRLATRMPAHNAAHHKSDDFVGY